MPLTAQALSDLTLVGHIALFPEAVAAVRSNSDTGVPVHSPIQKLIDGLATGLCDTIAILALNAVIVGAADPPGNPPLPTPFTIPGAKLAARTFLLDSGWNGPSSGRYVQSVIENMLENVARLGLIYGDTSLVVGTGTATFSIVSNPDLEDIARMSLRATLSKSLKATGVFGRDDDPLKPVNPTMASLIPMYADAYAKGLGTLTAAVPYVGTAATAAPATGVVTGSIQ